MSFEEVFYELYAYVANPEHRTYYVFLLTSLVMALVFLYWQAKKEKEPFSELVKRTLLNKDHWFTKTAFVDYGLILVNVVIRLLLIVPFVLTGTALAVVIKNKLVQVFGFMMVEYVPDLVVIGLYTLAVWLLSDLSKYILHWLCHRIPFLWQLHKVHHSATALNPLTEYRQHPVEMLLFQLEGIVVFGVITGVFYYLFPTQVKMWEILGVNAGRFLFYFFGGNLRHSHVELKFSSWLEKIFLSPFQHQIHHSEDPAHYYTNLGSQFALWDWMFGTLKKSSEVKEKLSFGLGVRENTDYTDALKATWAPFKNMYLGVTGRKEKNKNP